jgi:hypothetical protein
MHELIAKALYTQGLIDRSMSLLQLGLRGVQPVTENVSGLFSPICPGLGSFPPFLGPICPDFAPPRRPPIARPLPSNRAPRLRNRVEQGGTNLYRNNHDIRHPRRATPSASRLRHLRQ